MVMISRQNKFSKHAFYNSDALRDLVPFVLVQF